MNTNYLPHITDDTLFSSGRINVITFDRHFEPHEQDRTLKDKLKKSEEISGIFNWCIQGLKNFYNHGLYAPSIVSKATADYRASSDKVGKFIEDCLEIDKGNVTAQVVYQAYQSWCKSNGYGSENKGNFFAELKAKDMLWDTGTIDGKTVKRVVRGYRICSEYLDDDGLRPPPEDHSGGTFTIN